MYIKFIFYTVTFVLFFCFGEVNAIPTLTQVNVPNTPTTWPLPRWAPDPNNCNDPLSFTPECLIQIPTTDNSVDPRIFECFAYVQRGVAFVGSEVEPHIAAFKASDGSIKLAVYFQQDRMARLGGGTANVLAYSHNGGDTWSLTSPLIPNSRCSGALEGTAGAYDRASDPWVIFDKNGRLYAQSLNFDGLIKRPSGAIGVARSDDYGVNFNMAFVGDNPVSEVEVKSGNGSVPLLDKNSITADPVRQGPNGDPVLYSAWDRGNNKTDMYFSRSLDGGKTWEAKKKIFTTESDTKGFKNTTFAEGALLEVMPNGDLLLFFMLYPEGSLTYDAVYLRSKDGGVTWDRNATRLFTANEATIVDPEYVDANGNTIPIRGVAHGYPDIGRKANSSTIYIGYIDYNATPGSPYQGTSLIKLAKVVYNNSTDKWVVSGNPVIVSNYNAFVPNVDVAPNGTVGILFNDLKYDVLGDAPLSSRLVLTQYDSNLNTLSETEISNNDFRKAPLLFGSGGVIPGGYFLGDYYGLASAHYPDNKDYFLLAVPITTSSSACDPQITPPNILGPSVPNAVGISECNRNDIFFTKIKAQ